MADEIKTTALPDPQDPLPEANWLWRRVFIFAVTSAVLYLVYGSVDRLGAVAVVKPEIGIAAFVSIVKLLVFTINVMALFYMVAPSAEQITKMIKTASLLKSGVQINSRARYQRPNHAEETSATIGKPPLPPTPPVSSDSEASVGGDTPESLPDAPWAVPDRPARPTR